MGGDAQAQRGVVDEQVGGHEIVQFGHREVDHPVDPGGCDGGDPVPRDGRRRPPAQPVVVEHVRQEGDRLPARPPPIGVPVVRPWLAGGLANRDPGALALGLQHVVPHLHRKRVDRVLPSRCEGSLGSHSSERFVLAEDADLAAERGERHPVHDLDLERTTTSALVGDPPRAPLRTHPEAQQQVHHVERQLFTDGRVPDAGIPRGSHPRRAVGGEQAVQEPGHLLARSNEHRRRHSLVV